LIKWGYDNEDNIVKKSLNVIKKRYKWFAEYEKEEMKNRPTCPLVGKKK